MTPGVTLAPSLLSMESFSPRDLQQMSAMGIKPEEAARHVALFRDPPPYARLLRPCTPGDGILSISIGMQGTLLKAFDHAVRRGLVGRFIPASGAATRMFKDLLAYLAGPEEGPAGAVRDFFDRLPQLAFYGPLKAALAADGIDLDEAIRAREYRLVLSALLERPGLGFADLPKGLLPFHRYPEGPRTPFEEHLVEAAATARDDDGLCLLHFTVSPQHQAGFERLLNRVRPALEDRFDCRFEVSFSTQHPATDTLAVDLDNRPFRQKDGSLLFRPGGHGALIDNLRDLGREGWDVVLLKNVDNVVPDDRKPIVNLWKRLLGGCLLTTRERVFQFLDRLEALDGAPDDVTASVLAEAAAFVETDLCRPLPAEFDRTDARERARLLMDLLDRPLRVCGVVRNQGEPGGGPFWVESSRGEVSPQIVETSQIDGDCPRQQEILKGATHFNPVDLACGLRDRHGRPYDLHRFVDPATVFISTKSHEGRPLKALERPGLWNGAMAGWNTVFVEVPDATFAPVKTVLDLLRPEHSLQGG